MNKNMHERMLARGVAESMLRAGGKLPARPVDRSLWATLATTTGLVLVAAAIIAIFTAGA